jgi:hypothetical protein
VRFQCDERLPQPCVRFRGHRDQRWIVADDPQRGERRQRRDGGAPRLEFVHDDVARQQKPDFEFRVQRALSERRIAGAENDVLAKVPVELLLERLLP